MKFSLSWLYDHLDTKASPAQIADALTSLGIEVEDVSDPAAKLKDIIIGHVLTADRHPNADRLSVCTVVDGSVDAAGTPVQYQVVCGAPNVRADMKVAFARIGTVIPNTGAALKKGVIRSVESQGMLCSAEELLLGGDSSGIMDLHPSLTVGVDLITAFTECAAVHPDSAEAEILKRLDPIIDVSITPNRSDCFSIRGIARDLAALGIGTLKTKVIPVIASKGASDVSVQITQDAQTPHFAIRVIKGVKNAQSPAWVQDRLIAAGCRPISALVDVTNLMCLDLGRPMHVFDKNKLASNQLTIRLTEGGEILKALNDKDYTLDAGMIAVTDGSAGTVLSLAGIMGGRDSAVDENTTDVILESALFDAATIARAGQSTNIISDSRTRFERGVDAADVLPVLDMATQYILDWCGGEAFDVVQAGSPVIDPVTVSLTVAKLQALSGDHTLDLTMATDILTRLGFTIVSENAHSVTVNAPTYRHDIMIEEDLIEEILRMKGYDHLPETPLPLLPVQDMPTTRARLSTFFTTQGYNEAYTWSFVSADVAALFGNGVPLDKPLNAEMAVMRPSVLPGLLKIAANAQKRSQPNSRYFEMAPQFHAKAHDGKNEDARMAQPPVDELRTFTGLQVFSKAKRHWKGAQTAPDIFQLKNDVLTALSLFGVTNVQIEAAGPKYYHPGRVATIRQGRTVLATFGEIHPKVTQALDVAGTALGFEIMVAALPGEASVYQIIQNAENAHKDKKKAQPKAFVPAIYQSITRDFAFWVDAAVPFAQIMTIIQKVDRALITAIDVFDVYTGDKAPAGQKSIAVEVTLQPMNQTLSLDDVADLQNRITEAVLKGCGGRLRDAG